MNSEGYDQTVCRLTYTFLMTVFAIKCHTTSTCTNKLAFNSTIVVHVQPAKLADLYTCLPLYLMTKVFFNCYLLYGPNTVSSNKENHSQIGTMLRHMYL